MSAKKVGTLIKKARTDAGMTQEQLARKVRDCSASDISKAERGEKELTTDQLKAIAKATGVTQKSLLEAAAGTSSSSSKPSTSSRPSTTAKTTSMRVTAAERKLVELYRDADADAKKAAVKALKGDTAGIFGDLLGDVLGSTLSQLGKK